MTEHEKRPNFHEAAQRHADYYFNELMTQTDQGKLDLDFGQIALAVRRLREEVVGSLTYHAGDVQTKFLELAGGFVQKQLRKLIEGKATKEDISAIEKAMESVEIGEVEYPANIDYLKQLLQVLRTS